MGSRLLMPLGVVICLCSVVGAQETAILAKDGQSLFRIVAPVQGQTLEAAVLLQKSIEKISGVALPIERSDRPGKRKVVVIASDADLDSKWLKRRATPAFLAARSRLQGEGFLLSVQKERVVILGGSPKGAYYGVVHLLEKYLGCRMYAPDAEYMPRSESVALPCGLDAEQPVNTLRIVNGVMTQQNEAYRRWQRLNDHNEAFAKGYYVHTFHRLIPWETHFATHPEYFALVNGKRIIDQPCLTHPAVYELAVKKLEADMALQKDKILWSVSQNDNFSYCQCEGCAQITADEGSPAGPVIHFVNKIAARFPDKIISTLAYQYSRRAPAKIRPADNVQVMLCTIELNRSQAIARDPRSSSFLKDISDWGKICKHIYLWDYTVNFSHHITPFPNLHTLQPNIQFFTQNNVRAHFQQTNADKGHEFSELKAYLIARLLWNPAVNADSIMNDFLHGYFGAAGPHIRRYINRLSATVQQSGEWLDIYGHPIAHAETFLSPENVTAYNEYFDAAEKAVADRPELLQRVKTCRLPLQYAMIELGKSDMFGPRGFYAQDGKNFIPRPAMRQTLERFREVCENNGIRTLNEAGMRPGDYYQAVQRSLDIQMTDNLAFRKKTQATPPPSPKYARGDLALLSNGVQGASDYKVHWVGWEARDFELSLDLDTLVQPQFIQISTLYDPQSWILHPLSVACYASEDGRDYRLLATQTVTGDQRKEPITRNFTFKPPAETRCRYVKFEVVGAKKLFDWHPSAGGGAWVFVDEIVVR